jgi:DNA-binding transcriptional MocR family regulator
VLELAFHPDRSAETAIYRQLADYLRELILTGRLPAGEKLPATRELAASIAIGRNTANLAYQTLLDEGVLVAHVGQGTFVSGSALRTVSSVTAQRRAFVWDGLFSRLARTPLLGGLRPPSVGNIHFDFRGGRVDAEALPGRELQRAYRRVLASSFSAIACDADSLGYAPLRELIARTLLSRGIRCDASDVIVTSGAQQALDLIARVLIDPGDFVAIEQPGYFGAALSCRNAGAQLIGIDLDRDGLRTDQLARAMRSQRIKFVYTTPAAQMPTGVVMSDARRQALLELADQTQTPIVEDDYDSEFRYEHPPIPALKTQDSAGQVIYVGTFSKAIFPGLRLGYAVVARPLLSKLAAARFASSFGPDALAQAAVADMIESGAFERHVRRLRNHYAARRAAMNSALHLHMPAGTRWTEPRGGLGLWVTLPDGSDADAIGVEARQAGIAYTPGVSCYVDGRGEDQLSLSFANQPPATIEQGIGRLGEIVGQHLATRRSA